MFGSVPKKLKEKAAELEEKKDDGSLEGKSQNDDKPYVPDIESENDPLSKRRKEKINGYLPAIHEWRNDLSRHYEASSAKLGPISFDHLSNESIFESLQQSQHFQIRLKRLAPADDFVGHITVSFENEDKAETISSTLKEACTDITVKHTKPIDGKTVDVTEITKPERQLHLDSTPPMNNIIVLSRLNPEITEEDIRIEFPKAKSILIPKDSKTEVPRLYAYVELESQSDVEKRDGKSVTIGKEESKCTIQMHKLKRYPPIATVIKKLENEKELFSSAADIHQMTQEKKDELFELFKLGCHYERSLYISEKKREMVAECMTLFRKKVPKISILKGKKPRTRGNRSNRGNSGNRRGGTSMSNSRRGGNRSPYNSFGTAF